MVEVLYLTPNQNVRVLYDSSNVGGRYRVQNLVRYRMGGHEQERWLDAVALDSLPEAVRQAEQMDDVPLYRPANEMPNDDEFDYMT